MGAGKTAARRRLPTRDDGADREIRAGEPGSIRTTKMGQRQRRQRPASGTELNPNPSAPAILLAEADSLLREGQAEDALPLALHALDTLRQATVHDTTNPPPPSNTLLLAALNTVAEINLSLGDAASARAHFLEAVSLDPSGLVPSSCQNGVGAAEKFLWLAQLSEKGGHESVEWFSRGAGVLRREIGAMGGKAGAGEEKGEEKEEEGEEEEEEGEEEMEKRKKLAEALCGIVEVYMTDLSWDPCAETQCERLVAEALLVAPGCAEPLQTLASVRISQMRMAEAREALRGSLAVWRDLGPEEGAVPDFATRISLARLLMEVGMEEEAVGVLERMVLEDDGSVEAWYLGGWCLYLLGEKQERKKRGEGNGIGEEDAMKDVNGDDEKDDLSTQSMISSREWLRQSLKLYEMVEYEDERLRNHATELVRELDGLFEEEREDEVDGGEEEEEEEEEEDGLGDQSEEEQEDEEMDDS
ncbi:MAG: hypothetical protein Q9161_003124 [Pseudevernia consocians]